MLEEKKIQNYYNNNKRTFTFLNLEIRRLDIKDWISLTIYGSLILIYLFLNLNKKDETLCNIIFSLLLSTLIFTTPFGLRFRNIYFSLLWLLSSLLYLFLKIQFNWLPISAFALYHILRLIFWYKYKREFIPLNTGKGKMFRFVSKIEGRGGYKEDRKFMILLMVLGFFLFMSNLASFIRN